MRVFFDTNIAMDILTGRTGIVESARAVQKCPRMDRGISALTVANCTYILRGLGRTGIEQTVRRLVGEFIVLPLRRGELVQALQRGGPDFEDAVQYVTAEKAGAEIIVTRDLSGFPFSGKIRVMTPEQFLALK